MSQHDFEIANQGFPSFRSDLNNGLQALASNSAGATEPTTTYAYQFWYDETTDLLKMRNGDDDAWINLAFFDQTNDEWEVRSAVIQAVDSAGLALKTDDGTTRFSISDAGVVSFENYSFPSADGSDGQVLTTDGSGNIAFEDAAGGGITQADIWRLATNKSLTQATTEDLTANLERADDATSGLLGSGMSESSGVFTFPETGVYLVSLFGVFQRNATGSSRVTIGTNVSTDSGSNYDNVATAEGGITPHSAGADNHGHLTSFALVDVTNASTFRVKFNTFTDNPSVSLTGNTANNKTAFSFIRLGDT